ncbi:MAG: shikimate dehydrogenase [Bacteroidaceae bacterium]|nr:shikimate dehydrogenase [Bacteroidaceae bacterium]
MPAIYGLVGHPLGHSFSAAYFADKFRRTGSDAVYLNFDLDDIAQFPALFELHPSICGLNVTIPYKQAVIPYLASLSADAAAIGAVNVIKPVHTERGLRLLGHNSDHIGFSRSLRPLLKPWHKAALVLGTGGASLAVHHALHHLGVATLAVSRTPGQGRTTYDTLTPEIIAAHTLVVNTTPLGMFPKVDACPDIPYAQLTPRHLLYDLVYNPEETLFMRRGREHGATVKNGLEMLHGQAEAAWEIWQG